MTTRDMYNALLSDCRYKPDGCYPSTRYNKGKDIEQMNFNDAKILVGNHAYIPQEIKVRSDCDSTKINLSAYIHPSNRTTATIATCACRTPKTPTIENVIFNPPATIVFWSDKTKTIVKCDYEYEAYDPEKGIAMAIAKKLMGDNKGHYYELFKHWREMWEKQIADGEVVINISNDPFKHLANSLHDVFKKYGCKDAEWVTEVPINPKEVDPNGEEKD